MLFGHCDKSCFRNITHTTLTYTHTHTRAPTHSRVHTNAHTHAHARTHARTHALTHARTHAHAHTHRYTHQQHRKIHKGLFYVLLRSLLRIEFPHEGNEAVLYCIVLHWTVLNCTARFRRPSSNARLFDSSLKIGLTPSLSRPSRHSIRLPSAEADDDGNDEGLCRGLLSSVAGYCDCTCSKQ